MGGWSGLKTLTIWECCEMATGNRASPQYSASIYPHPSHLTPPTCLLCQVAVAAGKLEHATELWAMLEEGIGNATDNVDWYNVLRHNVGDDASSAGSPTLLTGFTTGDTLSDPLSTPPPSIPPPLALFVR